MIEIKCDVCGTTEDVTRCMVGKDFCTVHHDEFHKIIEPHYQRLTDEATQITQDTIKRMIAKLTIDDENVVPLR